MKKLNFNQIVETITQKSSRYQPQAYFFVREGLDQTTKKIQKLQARDQNTHLSAQELLNGLREHTLKEFGPMSKLVLNEWGLHSCMDFGQIVFELVEHGILGKKESDQLSDFEGHWSFDDAFVIPFLPKAQKREKRIIRRSNTLPKRPLPTKKSPPKPSGNPMV